MISFGFELDHSLPFVEFPCILRFPRILPLQLPNFGTASNLEEKLPKLTKRSSFDCVSQVTLHFYSLYSLANKNYEDYGQIKNPLQNDNLNIVHLTFSMKKYRKLQRALFLNRFSFSAIFLSSLPSFTQQAFLPFPGLSKILFENCENPFSEGVDEK